MIAVRETTEEGWLRALYRATLPEVHGYLMLATGGDQALAEDLTAETYLDATRHLKRGGGEIGIGWLKTVAKRRYIDHVRRQGSLQRRANRLRNEVIVLNRERTDHDNTAVYDALEQLSTEQRLVLVMKHLDGLSVSEIAVVIGRSEKATESLLGRARSAFRSAYRRDSDG